MLARRIVRIRNTNGKGHAMPESCQVCTRAPSELKKERTRRTQPDPLERVWPEIEARLNEAPENVTLKPFEKSESLV
jgi:hypothetical protein